MRPHPIMSETQVTLTLSEPAAFCLFMESAWLVDQSERAFGDCAHTEARRELHQALQAAFGVEHWTDMPPQPEIAEEARRPKGEVVCPRRR